MPDTCLFQSFLVLIMWGPYINPASSLNINMVDDKDKPKVTGTHSQKRKKEVEEKMNDSKHDTSGDIGISTLKT